MIRQANQNEASRLALLHQDNIETGFLSQLGRPFLELLYRELIRSDKAVCLVAEDKGLIIGYVCGCENTRSFYRDFLRRKFLSAGAKLFFKALKPATARGVFEHLRGARQAEAPGSLPTPELISLAVARQFRGAGIGGYLVAALASELDRRAIAEFKVVVGSSLLAANAFYKKMGFELVGKTEIHAGQVSNVFKANTSSLLKGALVGGDRH